MWESWFLYKPMLQVKDTQKARSRFIMEDSIWFGQLTSHISIQDPGRAHKLFKKGFPSWKDLWHIGNWFLEDTASLSTLALIF